MFKHSVQYSTPPTSLWVSQEPLASRNDTDPCLPLPHILKESEAPGTRPGQGPAKGFQISVLLPQFCKHRTGKCCQPSQPPNETPGKGQSLSVPVYTEPHKHGSHNIEVSLCPLPCTLRITERTESVRAEDKGVPRLWTRKQELETASSRRNPRLIEEGRYGELRARLRGAETATTHTHIRRPKGTHMNRERSTQTHGDRARQTNSDSGTKKTRGQS